VCGGGSKQELNQGFQQLFLTPVALVPVPNFHANRDDISILPLFFLLVHSLFFHFLFAHSTLFHKRLRISSKMQLAKENKITPN
jgi:hypothetical protein